MALLQTIQYVCGRINIPVPATVIGTTDTQVLQLLRLLEEEGTDLSKRGPWQGITFEATHTTLAAESQGAMTSIATNGFRSIITQSDNKTIWDRSSRLPVYGPLSQGEWQQRKALATTGPRHTWRLRGGILLVNPAPPAGLTWAFEYLSKNWILSQDGMTYKQYFTLDTDTILLPEDLVLMGLRWRWKKEKGLDYAEDFATYEAQVNSDLAKDGGKRKLLMDAYSERDAKPALLVPEQSWSL